MRLLRIIFIFQVLRGWLHILIWRSSDARTVIAKDVERWHAELQEAGTRQSMGWQGLLWLLWRHPPFRNLFYYRVTRTRNLFARIIVEIAKGFYRPMESLRITCLNIGEGLYIQHGMCAVIGGRSIGKNCWINQQVTIGFSNETDRPTIGDNVHVTAGAKVIGNITVGDNVIVGANAVVNKNVPPNCTVVGVPAHIIRRDGVRVHQPLE
jgi:serine O-acetyltransferase